MFVRRGSGKTLRRTDFQNSYYNVWIQKISKDQLRQMGDQEGLVLQGCGGDPQGWLDTSDLGNGDSVTVTAQLPESAVQQGYVLTQTQTTLTVEGLDTYVTSLSQLNDADRKEIETKLTQFFNKTLENGTGLNVGTGNNTGISNRDGVSCTNLAFDNTVYDTAKQGVTIIPVTLDIEGSFYWWGSDFYADKIEKSIPNACGFFTIPGLKIDKDGNVVDIDDLYIEEGGFFVDKDLMEDEILSQFGV